MERTTRYSKKQEAILNAICGTDCHPSAEWVYQKLKPSHPDLSLGTVYRNLNALVEAGEIKRIPGVNGVDRFDGNHMPHYHMKCNDCGTLYDLEPESEDALQRMETVIRETFSMEAVEIKLNTMLLKGTCRQCGRG